ncbi:unnamed protein product [Arabidopsis arenosa]|uniref:Uncharacterized protein n=1 Tax=Arabidopsis arenosa TaxID=38785 RepID=A0A8S2A4Y6_ARAAE|nr:unnamed protein product [Arabidopsis arenosa]
MVSFLSGTKPERAIEVHHLSYGAPPLLFLRWSISSMEILSHLKTSPSWAASAVSVFRRKSLLTSLTCCEDLMTCLFKLSLMSPMQPVVPSVVSSLLEPLDLFKLSSSRLAPAATPVIHRDGMFPPSLFPQISWKRFTGDSPTSILFSGSAFDSRRLISLPKNCYTVDLSSGSPKSRTLWTLQASMVTPLTSASLSVSLSDELLPTTISKLSDVVVRDLVLAEHVLSVPPSCRKVEPPFSPRLRLSSANWNGSPTINGRLLYTQNAIAFPRVSSDGQSLGLAGSRLDYGFAANGSYISKTQNCFWKRTSSNSSVWERPLLHYFDFMLSEIKNMLYLFPKFRACIAFVSIFDEDSLELMGGYTLMFSNDYPVLLVSVTVRLWVIGTTIRNRVFTSVFVHPVVKNRDYSCISLGHNGTSKGGEWFLKGDPYMITANLEKRRTNLQLNTSLLISLVSSFVERLFPHCLFLVREFYQKVVRPLLFDCSKALKFQESRPESSSLTSFLLFDHMRERMASISCGPRLGIVVAGFMASSSILSYRVAYLCVGTRYP